MSEPVQRRPGFESPFPVAVSQISATEWELTAPLVYRATHQTFLIEPEADTDFGSVPRWLRGLIQFDEVASAVVHDRLWRRIVPDSATLPPRHRVTYRDADGILRRWIIWAGVRLGALTRPGGRHLWWRDAPTVVGISLAVLPLVLLPGPLGLGLLTLAERAVAPLDRRRHQLQAQPYQAAAIKEKS